MTFFLLLTDVPAVELYPSGITMGIFPISLTIHVALRQLFSLRRLANILLSFIHPQCVSPLLAPTMMLSRSRHKIQDMNTVKESAAKHEERLVQEQRCLRLCLRDVRRHEEKVLSLLTFLGTDEKTKSAASTSSGRFFHVGMYASAAYLKTKSFEEYLETQLEMLDAISE